MTGGRVVILGATGRNFAAGMSGGIAYIWDPKSEFSINCNPEMVDLDPMDEAGDITELESLIQKHANFTGSVVAEKILANWQSSLAKFIKVMPKDLKRVLEKRSQQVSAG
jgi:glutamate synthase domain-containing protein 3